MTKPRVEKERRADLKVKVWRCPELLERLVVLGLHAAEPSTE
ncbi:MAG: hypothetical protein O3A10_13965 [Chloroflexi bacterium]|nr:hypothetical protein [Chloroflexota bacterium]MDA1147631.1 hypothetical protein [Chloroflexota bacterium]